jgi:hypothetical protein
MTFIVINQMNRLNLNLYATNVVMGLHLWLICRYFLVFGGDFFRQCFLCTAAFKEEDSLDKLFSVGLSNQLFGGLP